ncbi:hypothetical protein K3163_13500 [Qipengyuania sp. 1NDW9]|uniref:hypothetical protein n=1 Tax=Qipengyuania xiapuensis TaxID=2867236 RepID=UPI001C873515|nr:hypothetical protein [Qipengyuania xiapuensis]MBX7494226.1 hypothetical protein [Qipengyuania xiapuensis]
MGAIKAVFGWIFRNALLFALIVAALIAHSVWSEAQQAEQAAQSEAQAEIDRLETTAEQAATAQARLEEEAARAREELAAYPETVRRAGIEELRDKRRDAVKEREQFRARLPGDAERWRQAATLDADAMLERALVELQIRRLDRQIAFLTDSIEIVQDRRQLDQRLEDLRNSLANQEDIVARLKRDYDSKDAALKEFERRWDVIEWFQKKKHDELKEARSKAKDRYDAAVRARDRIKRSIQRLRATMQAGQATMDAVMQSGADEFAQLEQQAAQELDAQEDRLMKLNEEHPIAQIMRNALLILLGIIAMPFIIRTLFYYVFAPMAARRASIRIEIPGLSAAPDPVAEPSRVSVPVTLDEGEELLIRQDYLQTSAVEGEKATRWLLDYSHPVSSLAAGLGFLTRIRGKGTSTVSAVRDPFAELTEIVLPENSACVLHPRALVALVQPTGKTMRITSHWRLFNLNAWLTMQLRFFVFHGPGRLVVKGGRGVRVERAEQGRIFGQDQLVGFSADLAYSVTRTETFAPYLFGREQLFKDKVQDSGGILIIEEAPLAGRQGGEVRRGLEGAFDAGLKAFGL